jgi:hypothetical protein
VQALQSLALGRGCGHGQALGRGELVVPVRALWGLVRVLRGCGATGKRGLELIRRLVNSRQLGRKAKVTYLQTTIHAQVRLSCMQRVLWHSTLCHNARSLAQNKHTFIMLYFSLFVPLPAETDDDDDEDGDDDETKMLSSLMSQWTTPS